MFLPATQKTTDFHIVCGQRQDYDPTIDTISRGVTYIPYPSLQMSDEPKIRRWEHTNTAKNALRKLQDAYEYDCYDGPCYAYYTLRTEAQDSNPKTDDISQICDIETAEDGWYIVSYLEMG